MRLTNALLHYITVFTLHYSAHQQKLRPLTRWHDASCHPGACDRRDGVAHDVVLASLNGQRVAQSQQAHLGGRVVGLTKVAIQS